MENVAENTQVETQEEKAPEDRVVYITVSDEELQAMLQAAAKTAAPHCGNDGAFSVHR